MERKIYLITFLQIFLIVSTVFSFSYILSEAFSVHGSGNYNDETPLITKIGRLIFNEDTLVSALEPSDITEGTSTCIFTKESESCVEYPASECDAQCSGSCVPAEIENVAACKPGTCYNALEGTCAPGSPQGTCSASGGEWFDDPFENIPQCREGCCLIGGQAKFATERQCAREAEFLGTEREFRSDVTGEVACLALAEVQSEGACVFEEDFERTCVFTEQIECLGTGGDFFEGKLCSHPLLKTNCEAQHTTGCADGKHEVYWYDSCGNRENIFSLPKSQSFNKGEVLSKLDSCSLGNSRNKLANSNTCGNCAYVAGSRCGLASDGDKPSVGDYICKDLACTDSNGERREHGESWCAYQGSIGVDEKNNRATDTPGSGHFRQTCTYGEVETEACADYRTEICSESKTKINSGTFSSAACIRNRANECINYNFEFDEDEIDRTEKIEELCEKNSDCFVKEVDVSSKFQFNICAPKYPSGFSLDENGRGGGAEAICGIGSQKCQYVKIKKLFGSKEINKECLQPKFVEEMNNLCMSLGDCGGSVNYQGVYTKNFDVERSDKVELEASQGYIAQLSKYSEVVPGKIAEPGDLNEYFGDLGIPGFLGTTETPGDPSASILKMGSTTVGMMGTVIGLAANTVTGATLLGPLATAQATTYSSLGASASGPGLTAAGGVLVGAAIGVSLVSMLIKFAGVGPGLSPGITYALLGVGAVAGGIIGAQVIATKGVAAAFGSFSSGGLASAAAFAWVAIAVIVVLIIIFKLLGIGKVTKIDVQFQCNVWQPPTGGSSCGQCGGDGLPCSRYSCQSLGQTCELINEGTGEEECVDINPNDVTPPVIKPWSGILSEDHKYSSVSDNGFKIESSAGCLQPYTNLIFGISLDAPAQCRYELEHTDSYKDMKTGFGFSRLYRTNHTMIIPVPDLQSLGLNGYDPDLKGEYEMLVRCEDKKGNANIREYGINFCISQGPNIEPPRIVSHEPLYDRVAFGETESKIAVYTNEPAECKWDFEDKDYSLMANDFTCANEITERELAGWKCTDKVEVGKEARTYYVRCNDQPWLATKIKDELGDFVDNPEADEGARNANSQSYDEIKIGSSEKELKIDSITPSSGEVLRFGVEPASVEVIVRTSGGYNGKAKCSYKFGNTEAQFLNTWDTTHSQVFQALYPGKVTLPVICEDEIGNRAEKTTEFNIELDTDQPRITRIYDQSGKLKIITDEDAVCKVSTLQPAGKLGGCRFEFEDGSDMGGLGREHLTSLGDETYYIKCKDEFDRGPGTSCSSIVRRGVNAQEL